MKGLGFSPRPEGTKIGRTYRRETSSGGHSRGPVLEGPRFGDVVFEVGVILALHLAIAFAVVMTLKTYGIV